METEKFILEQESAEKNTKDIEFDTEETIQQKLEQARETGETVEIVREIPIGCVKEKIYWVGGGEKTDSFNFFVTDSLIIKNKKSDKKWNINDDINEDTVLIRQYYNTDKLRELNPGVDIRKSDKAFDSPYAVLREEGLPFKILVYGSLEEDGTRLSLAHEIAHSKESDDFWNKVNKNAEKLWVEFEKSEDNDYKFPNDNEILVKEDLNSRSRPVKIKTFLDAHKLKAKQERNAWAGALKIYRSKKWIEPDFQNGAEIEEFIHDGLKLGSYEMSFMKEQIADKNRAKMSGLYSHEFYRLFKEKKNKKKAA